MSLKSVVRSTLGAVAQALRRPILKLGTTSQEPDPYLQVLRTCSEPKVDIVCIPDLNENPLEDWTQVGNSQNVNWLTDLLPVSFPYARILLYKYETRKTKLSRFIPDMEDEASDLLGHLWNVRREEAKERPLLFLVTGSGMILARTALAMSSARIGYREILRSIYLSTGSILMLDALKHRTNPWRTIDDFLDEASDDKYTRELFRWSEDRFRPIASTIDTTIIVLRKDSGIGNSTGQKLLPTASKYKDIRFLDEHARIADLEKTGDSITRYGNPDDADYQDLISYLSDSMETGFSLCAAKWMRDTSQRSFSVTECEERALEAEKEYDRQLEQTALRGREWCLEVKPSFRPIKDYWRRKNLKRRRPIDEPKSDFELAVNRMRRIEDEFGSFHARTLECLNDLATWYIRKGVRAKAHGLSPDPWLLIAVRIAQRLLVSWESIFGLQSAKVLYALRRMGTVFKAADNTFLSWPFWDHDIMSRAFWTKEIELRSKLLVALENKVAIDSKRPGNQEKSAISGELEDKIQQHVDAIARRRIEVAMSYDNRSRRKEAEPIYEQVMKSSKGLTLACRLLCLEKQADNWFETGALWKAVRNYIAILQARGGPGCHIYRYRLFHIECRVYRIREKIHEPCRYRSKEAFVVDGIDVDDLVQKSVASAPDPYGFSKKERLLHRATLKRYLNREI